QAIIEIASPGRLFDTTYGRLVLVKVGLLAVVLAVAWYSRRLVQAPARRALVAAGAGSASEEIEADDEDDFTDEDDFADEDPPEPPVRPLRRSIIAELALTGVVLAVAAALVQTPPARSATPTGVAQPYSVTMGSDLYRLR